MQNLSQMPEEEQRSVRETDGATVHHFPVADIRPVSRKAKSKASMATLAGGRNQAIWTGFVLSAWIASLLAWGLVELGSSREGLKVLWNYSPILLALAPLLGGLIQAFCWRRFDMTPGKCALYSAFNIIISALGAAVFLHEWTLFLVFPFPVLWVSNYAGAAIGGAILRRGSRPLRVSISTQ